MKDFVDKFMKSCMIFILKKKVERKKRFFFFFGFGGRKQVVYDIEDVIKLEINFFVIENRYFG